MTSKPIPVVDDNDVRSALEWFVTISIDAENLRRRISLAQESYPQRSVSQSQNWPETHHLLDSRDLIASYVGQADALLRDRRSYDLHIGSRVIPFFKQIGKNVHVLQ